MGSATMAAIDLLCIYDRKAYQPHRANSTYLHAIQFEILNSRRLWIRCVAVSWKLVSYAAHWTDVTLYNSSSFLLLSSTTTLLFGHKLEGVGVYSEARGAVGGPVVEELVAQRVPAGAAQQLDHGVIIRLRLLPQGVRLHRLGEGGPRRVVRVLGLTGEQRVRALHAHVRAWCEMIPVRFSTALSCAKRHYAVA